MKITIDMSDIEKVNKIILDNLDPKYAGLVDSAGIDRLKKEITANPELQKIFKS